MPFDSKRSASVLSCSAPWRRLGRRMMNPVADETERPEGPVRVPLTGRKRPTLAAWRPGARMRLVT